MHPPDFQFLKILERKRRDAADCFQVRALRCFLHILVFVAGFPVKGLTIHGLGDPDEADAGRQFGLNNELTGTLHGIVPLGVHEIIKALFAEVVQGNDFLGEIFKPLQR